MLEPNNIYLGDCYELIKQIPDKSVDLVYTDIPYKIHSSGGGIYITKVKNQQFKSDMKDENLSEGIDYKVFDELVRVLKQINLYIWCSRDQIKDVLDYFVSIGCYYNILVWLKDNPLPLGGSPFLSDIEYCLCFYQDTKKFVNGWEHKKKWYISHFNQEDKKKYRHPTIKPIEFVKQHIINLSNEGDIVLDPFSGSGTTLKACQELNRQYIGIEINPTYYNIAKDRLNNINAKGEVSLF